MACCTTDCIRAGRPGLLDFITVLAALDKLFEEPDFCKPFVRRLGIDARLFAVGLPLPVPSSTDPGSGSVSPSVSSPLVGDTIAAPLLSLRLRSSVPSFACEPTGPHSKCETHCCQLVLLEPPLGGLTTPASLDRHTGERGSAS